MVKRLPHTPTSATFPRALPAKPDGGWSNAYSTTAIYLAVRDDEERELIKRTW